MRNPKVNIGVDHQLNFASLGVDDPVGYPLEPGESRLRLIMCEAESAVINRCTPASGRRLTFTDVEEDHRLQHAFLFLILYIERHLNISRCENAWVNGTFSS